MYGGVRHKDLKILLACKFHLLWVFFNPLMQLKSSALKDSLQSPSVWLNEFQKTSVYFRSTYIFFKSKKLPDWPHRMAREVEIVKITSLNTLAVYTKREGREEGGTHPEPVSATTSIKFRFHSWDHCSILSTFALYVWFWPKHILQLEGALTKWNLTNLFLVTFVY